MVLTSKLIDGTFPDYARVIPAGNDKELIVDKKDFEAAVDRVSTVSSERGRAVKLSLTGGKLMLSVTNPDSGSATEEIEVEYDADPLDIGFNSRYLLDIAAQIDGEVAVLKLADPGLADADPGQGRQGRALRADADAGVERRWHRSARPACRHPCVERSSWMPGQPGLTSIARHDRRPHPPPDADQFPQLSRGAARRRRAARWC